MFDLRTHKTPDLGKPKSVRRLGIDAPQVERYLDYQVEISQRPASPTTNRAVFAVRIDGGEALRRAYITGFLTEKSARAAAHAEIHKLEFKYGGGDSPIAHILHSLKRQRAARKSQEKEKAAAEESSLPSAQAAT